MIPLAHAILMILNHFLADFGLQTNRQAQMKSEDSPEGNKQLLYHVLIYSSVMTITGCIMLGFLGGLLFGAITAICHYFTDYYSSRIGKPYWEAKDLHNGFVIIGADQLCHYIQLFSTYELVRWIQHLFK